MSLQIEAFTFFDSTLDASSLSLLSGGLINTQSQFGLQVLSTLKIQTMFKTSLLKFFSESLYMKTYKKHECQEFLLKV